jgi:hypothetical protein
MAIEAANQKAHDKFPEVRTNTEKSDGVLALHVQELRKSGTPIADRKDTASASLPALEIAADARPTGETSPPAKTGKQWTVAVELGATMPGGQVNPNGFGADNKLRYLKQLAGETAGKPVSFVVSAQRTTDRQGNPCHADVTPSASGTPAEAQRASACDVKAGENSLHRTERYFIHDGKIDRLPDATARSTKDEISGLLADASRLSPSSKLGLIIQSHGVGARGIETNRGSLSPEQLAAGIQRGLQGSGHDRLDFLNFDACNMSTLPVLAQMQKVSDNVVASAASEGAKAAGENGDGQNLGAGVRKILNTPSLSGREAAAGFVESARAGDNGTGKANNTTTLASFDMTKFPGFQSSLDRFGRELAASFRDSSNQAAIRAIVESSIRPETESPEVKSHERDMGSFARLTLAAIEAGKLKPAGGELEKATRDFLQNLDSLASDRFGEQAKGYENLAGLTANIPGKEILDRKEIGRLQSPIHQFTAAVDKLLKEDLQISTREAVLERLKEHQERMSYLLEGAPGNPVAQLKDAQKVIEQAKSEPELIESLQKMKQLLEHIERSEDGRGYAHDAEREAGAERAEYRRTPRSGVPGWDAFISSLEGN